MGRCLQFGVIQDLGLRVEILNCWPDFSRSHGLISLFLDFMLAPLASCLVLLSAQLSTEAWNDLGMFNTRGKG